MFDEQDKVRDFIEAGTEIAGGTAGAAVGLLKAGPAGIIVGAAVGPAITKVIKRTCLEFYDRISGSREKVRGGAAVAYALIVIADRIQRGYALRDDGFFDFDSSRSSAEEILEGVLIKSRNEHEEKKTRYYANIFSTAAFDSQFTPEDLNHVLALAQRLTYRQLCLLHLFSRPQPIPLPDHNYDAPSGSLSSETVTVLAEIYDLYQQSLVHLFEAEEHNYMAMLGMDDVHPSRMVRTSLGDMLHHLMHLQSLPFRDLEHVASVVI